MVEYLALLTNQFSMARSSLHRRLVLNVITGACQNRPVITDIQSQFGALVLRKILHMQTEAIKGM